MNFLDKYNIKVDKNLLLNALTHSSYSNEHECENYERLEYLGDAVLELIVSEYLYKAFSYEEGDMTKLRSSYVCEHALYEYAKKIDLISHIRVGNGQINNINETIIADVFESVLACIFLTNGYNKCRDFALSIIKPFIDNKVVFYSDYKSLLQEMVQTTKKSLEYRVVKEKGPAHDKTYEVEVVVDDIVYGKGIGKSKKEAEANAAFNALEKKAEFKGEMNETKTDQN